MNDIQTLKSRLEGEVLPTHEYRSRVLSEDELLRVTGGMPPVENTPSCCPCADDCQD